MSKRVGQPPVVYPAGWKALSRRIRFDVAGGQCQCTGGCGLHRTTPGPRRCIERDRQPAVWARGLVVLTVAHTCECDPPCAIETHLLALCNRCHLRLDVELHQRHARETRAKRRAASNYDLFEVRT